MDFFQIALLVAALGLFGFLIYRAYTETSRERAKRRLELKAVRRHHQPWDSSGGRPAR